MNQTDSYQSIARVYDLLLNPLLDPVRKDICRILLCLKIDSVVDLGCGTGRQCDFMHEHGFRTFGVDSSPAMLEKARQKTSQNITYLEQDMRSTCFPGNSLDAALISLALHEHPADAQEQIIGEARRIIRPGGFLVLLDHAGIESLAGWAMHCLSLLPERMAGRKHFNNYLLFMRNHGLQGVIKQQHDLNIIRKQKLFLDGLMLCLARVPS